MDITLYKKKPCPQCDSTVKVFDQKGVKEEELTIIPNVADEMYADALTYIKGLGYLQAPVVTVAISDDMRDQIPTRQVAYDTITRNDLALKMIESLKNDGFAHWSGFNPDNINAAVAIRELVLQPA